jgi:hypothetical protein
MPGCTRRFGRSVSRPLAWGVGLALAAGLLAACVPAAAQAAARQPGGRTAHRSHAIGPTGLSEFQASDRAKATGKPVVASALTTPTSETVARPAGLFTVTESLLPVRGYRDGKWQALNPDLHLNVNHTVSPALTTAGLTLSGGGSGPLAVLSSHGRSMSLYWPRPLPVPTLSGDTATYPNVLPGVNLAVTANPQGGLSDMLVVKDAAAAADPALASLRLRVSAPDLKVTANAGSLQVAASATAEPVFTAPAPQMWDSAPPPAGTVVQSQNGTPVSDPSGMPAYSSASGPGAAARTWQVPLSVSGNTITLTPPSAALTASGNVYPLYIDPSFNPDPVGEDNSAWTEVESGFATNTGDWDESSDLQVGLCDWSSCNGLGVARSFFRMPMPSELTSSSSINSADIYMTEVWSASCTPETLELRPTSAISSSTSWASQPSWSSTTLSQSIAHGYDSSCPYSTNDVTWNVASEVASDAASHASNQTWGLMAGNESDDLYWKQFTAGSSAITLSVSYHNPPNAPTALENAPAGACKSSESSEAAIGADAITLSATVGDNDNANGDDSLSTTFTVKSYSTGDAVYTSTVDSGNAAGGLTVSTVIPLATAEGWSTAAASYDWYATTKDAGSPVLTSPQSETCYFLYNPAAPAAPGVSVNPSTAAIGTAFSATFTPPTGCGSTSPCPTSYTYQLGVGQPVTVSPNSSPASGDWTGNITMTQVGPAQLTVYGTASGGNPGTTTSAALTGAPPSSPYPDGYFTGGSYPSLLTTGTGADPSLWLSVGTGNGQLAPATDIGSLGTLVNPGTDGPADWAGAEVLHGDFTGHDVEDVMAYYPSGTHAGSGVIIGGPGDAAPLIPASGNSWAFSSGQLTDPTYANDDNPFVLVGAGDASELDTGLDDLFGILGDTSASDGGTGYELDLYSATTIGQYEWDQVLSTTAPDGTADWNNYTLATAQPGGNSSAVVLFALDKATGALYESVNPTCNTTVTTGCGEGPSSTLVGMTGTWTEISTPWGTTAPDLVSADVNNAGTLELWTVYGGAATPYTLSGTTLTQENNGAPLGYSADDWQLNDGSGYAKGSSATTSTDSVTGETAAVTGSCTGSCFWADDDFFGTVANTTGDTGSSYVAAPAGIIPSTAVTASISIWFQTTSTDGVLVSYDGKPPSSGATVTSDYDPVLYVGTDGKLKADWWPIGQLSSTAPVDDGLWHHAVLTANGATETLTLDGVVQGTATGVPSFTWAAPGYLDFGAGYLGGAWGDEPHYEQDGNTAYLTYFSGELADVQVSFPPLTAAEYGSGGPAVYDPVTGDEYLYASGTNGTAWQELWSASSGWSAVNLSGYITGRPSAIMDPAASNNMEVYARYTSGLVYEDYQQPSGVWSGWGENTSGSPSIEGNPAAIHNPLNGSADIFATATSGVMYEDYWTAGGGWAGWQSLGGDFSSAPDAVYDETTSSVVLCATATSGNLLVDSWTSAGGWTGWQNEGGDFTGTPSAIYDPFDGYLEIYGQGAGGVTAEVYQTSTGTWGSASLGGSAIEGSPSAVYDPAGGSSHTGDIEVYATTTAGTPMEDSWTPATGWSGWVSLGGVLSGGPDAVYAPALGGMEVYGINSAGEIYVNAWTPAGGWSGWKGTGGTAGNL